MKRLLLLLFTGALISLTSCSRGRVVIPAHIIHPNFQPLVTSSVVFQIGPELFALDENVYYSGNIEIAASDPLRDSIVIDLASGSWSGDTISGSFSGAGYSTTGGVAFAKISGTFSNVPPQ
jgi:hypothetical protein